MAEPRWPCPPYCCKHGVNTHSRLACQETGCDCVRRRVVPPAPPASAESTEVPDGYTALVLLVCTTCGALVGDTELHTQTHPATQPDPSPKERT